MANPTPYERGYSFAGFQSTSPQTPLPGPRVDAELDNIERTTTDLISGLGDIRRSDGKLKNAVVTLDSLSPEITTGVQPAVAWTPLTQYEPGAVVFYTTGFYRALISHVSSPAFATDLAAGKWYLFADLGPLAADAAQARDQAVVAAATATTQAGIATTGSTTATTQAGIATSAASAASGSASTASTAAGTATTQAGIATTQAGLATAAKNAAQAAAATVVNGFKVTQRFSASDGNLAAGQTSFTVPAYDTPYGYVYRNGAKLVNGVDVTFPTSTSFLLAAGAGASDVLEFEGFGVFNVANLAANQVAYSNTTSGLVATQAQAAIDELAKGRLLDLQVFSASGTWTKPTGCKSIEIEVWAGGGSGGSAAAAAASQGSGGGGGGGGGYSYKFVTSGIGATEAVTVGAGGAAPAAGANAGNAGSTSSFGAHCSATGGQGGTSTVSTAANQMGGGLPGVGSNGNVNMGGSGGDTLVVNAAASNLRFGGQGGDAPGGGGGGGAAVNAAFSAGSVAGTQGSSPGGGGAGAMSYNGGAAAQGGAGGNGLVIVRSYG